jgi:UDP-glucose 4-epimerase
VELGAEVTVLDDLTTGQSSLVPDGISRFVHGSVTDAPLVDELVKEQQLVFHLAVRNIILSTRQTREDYEVNIGGTLNVLMAARSAPDLQRVLYTSSVSIYGNPRALPITEDDGINILSPYAASKLAGESYCNAFFEMFQLPVTVIRYSNVYGPHQSPKNPYCGVVSKFFHSCMSGRPIHIHGSGMQTRDLTYVDDAVEATLIGALAPRAEGETFNVGSGFEVSVRDLARRVIEVVGGDTAVEYVDRRDIDNVQRRVLNIEKARRVLRWIPQLSLEAGLARTYEWLRLSGSIEAVAAMN